MKLFKSILFLAVFVISFSVVLSDQPNCGQFNEPCNPAANVYCCEGMTCQKSICIRNKGIETCATKREKCEKKKCCKNYRCLSNGRCF